MSGFRKHVLPAVLASFGLAAQASAEIRSVEGPVPTSAESSIYGAAYVQGASLSVVLSHYGYVEEEYFVRGKAAAYRHTSKGTVRQTEEHPYVTRIVVRRPADASRFSGVVHFEPIHPTQGFTSHWLTLNRYLMSRGDIYVVAGTGSADKGWSGSPHQPDETAPVGSGKIEKWFDPQRYAELQWPEEEGIRFEVMADIGRKLRSKDADNPLKALDVRAILVGGWSHGGSFQRTFINEGFHDRARLPDGHPVFSGYLIGVSGRRSPPGYLPLYNDEPFVQLDNPRRDLKPIDVPVIEFLTELEAGREPEKKQAPDRDGPIGAHRLYELGGVIHTESLVDPSKSYPDRPNIMQLIQRNYPKRQLPGYEIYGCPLLQSDVPHGDIVRATVENLRRWVLDGVVPPHAPRLKWADGKPAKDEAGNQLGGIRPAEFQVPLAFYGPYPGTDLPGCFPRTGYAIHVRNPLSHAELIRRYQTPERYLELYDAATDRLVQERWLLPEDALRLKAKAREYALQQF